MAEVVQWHTAHACVTDAAAELREDRFERADDFNPPEVHGDVIGGDQETFPAKKHHQILSEALMSSHRFHDTPALSSMLAFANQGPLNVKKGKIVSRNVAKAYSILPPIMLQR